MKALYIILGIIGVIVVALIIRAITYNSKGGNFTLIARTVTRWYLAMKTIPSTLKYDLTIPQLLLATGMGDCSVYLKNGKLKVDDIKSCVKVVVRDKKTENLSSDEEKNLLLHFIVQIIFIIMHETAGGSYTDIQACIQKYYSKIRDIAYNYTPDFKSFERNALVAMSMFQDKDFVKLITEYKP